MPFKEEIANWSFPSLDRIQTVTGKPVTEHRLLPKKDLLHSMDDFVDSMMLPVYAVEGDAEEAPAKQEDEAGDKADA
jgi:ATP-dependent DNA helicase 2 subunit 2